jgi:putative transposase
MAAIVASTAAKINRRSRRERRAVRYRPKELGRQQQEEYEARFKEERDGLAERMDAAATKATEKVIQESIDADAKEVVGREKREPRDDNDASEADVECNHCHKKLRVLFFWDGVYQRFLLTLYGVVCLRVPRVRCVCGGWVSPRYAAFEPYQRCHEGVKRQVFGLTGMCLSLRQTRMVLAMRGQAMSIATLSGQVVSIANLSGKQFDKEHPVMAAILLDAIWARVAAKTGEERPDRRNRKRKRKRVGKKPVMVAWGIDPETGKAALIGWMVGNKEDEASWQKFLEQLHSQGVRYEHGLRLFVHDGSSGLDAALGMVSFGAVQRQRCIFHKMRNVLKAIKGQTGMSKEEKDARCDELLQDLATIWVAPDEETARQRLATVVAKWEEREPKAVETLQNGFDATVVYFRLQAQARAAGEEWQPQYLRTTSLLERVNRIIRAKLRSSTMFQTEGGLLAAAYLALGCRGKSDPRELWGWLGDLVRRLEVARCAA